MIHGNGTAVDMPHHGLRRVAEVFSTSVAYERQDRGRVLLVDDDRAHLRAVARLLRDEYEVTLAGSGVGGLSAILSSGPFDVVVSDFRMPEVDGLTFLDRVQVLAPSMPRILLTGFAEPAAIAAATRHVTPFELLTKPCPPPVLRAAVARAVQHSRRTGEHTTEYGGALR